MAKTWPKVIQEAYVTWNTMRNLGFDADHLFFETDGKKAAITLRRNGDLTGKAEFTIVCGDVGVTPQMIFAVWSNFIEELKAGNVPESDLNKFVEDSHIGKQYVALCAALATKGIKIPAVEEA